MARKNQLVEMNTFVAGLVTEASPLTFPQNASLDEQNFDLLRNGSRRRRLGMDYEEDFVEVTTAITNSNSLEHPVNTFRWKNVDGNPDVELLVVQFGGTLLFFSLGSASISPNLIDTIRVENASIAGLYSFASVDGKLIVATGSRALRKFSYSQGDSFVTSETFALSIRDTFGVYESDAVGNSIANRPSTLSDAHLYNLRNQTWGYSRLRSDSNIIQDPIGFFTAFSAGKYPSNSDNVTYYLYPNPELSSDRISKRFVVRDMYVNQVGSTLAPKGFFIIDPFNRGASRQSAYSSMMSRDSKLTYDLSGSLPTDQSYHRSGVVGGPKVVCEFAGRLFYAGNPSSVLSGDEFSPDMGKYVLFSKLVENESDFGVCYQVGDPTSSEEFDLLDTDGGFIRISECNNICHMATMGNNLVVFAQNGVWYISGGNEYGFKATDYRVVKITDRGTRSPRAVVSVNDSLYYWSDDGIYVITNNQYGDVVAENISAANINTLYTSISESDKLSADGVYDSYERKIRWLYGNRIRTISPVYELVLDIDLKAFYKHRIGKTNIGSQIPTLLSAFITPPYTIDTYEEVITYNGENITYLGEDVTYSDTIQVPITREVKYLTLTDRASIFYLTFSSYTNRKFKDWVSEDGVGIDAEAYMYTGYMSGETFLLNKQVPYISFFLERTEDGFDTVDGDLVPRNQSSCKVRAQWDWSDNINSGRWGQEFQAYRYLRHWIPATGGSSYDYGHSVISTKNKLRGKGKVLSLYIHTDPGKDCRLLGWSMMVSQDGNA